MKFYDNDNKSVLICCECPCDSFCHPGVVHTPSTSSSNDDD